ncbi:hypothetical protein SORDD20_01709 [Streptococcus oralis]|nr:hypothetical protein SORDD20_01709 [Streptococcus oralis]
MSNSKPAICVFVDTMILILQIPFISNIIPYFKIFSLRN